MNKPPFSLPSLGVLQSLASALPVPPVWLQAEMRNRLVLLLNHVLTQEPQAMERLKRQQGKTVHAVWGQVELMLRASPAGLLEQAPVEQVPDLQLRLLQPTVLELAQTVLAGAKPPVDIQGDVQLAAEVAWLVDNVRWDVEEDVARLLGDAPAHLLLGGLRRVGRGLKAFVQRNPVANDPAVGAGAGAAGAAS